MLLLIGKAKDFFWKLVILENSDNTWSIFAFMQIYQKMTLTESFSWELSIIFRATIFCWTWASDCSLTPFLNLLLMHPEITNTLLSKITISIDESNYYNQNWKNRFSTCFNSCNIKNFYNEFELRWLKTCNFSLSKWLIFSCRISRRPRFPLTLQLIVVCANIQYVVRVTTNKANWYILSDFNRREEYFF